MIIHPQHGPALGPRPGTEGAFNQVALGVFVATFVYGLVVLRGVRGTAQVDPFVPQTGVTVSFALVLASVLVFLAYIHRAVLADIAGRQRMQATLKPLRAGR